MQYNNNPYSALPVQPTTQSMYGQQQQPPQYQYMQPQYMQPQFMQNQIPMQPQSQPQNIQPRQEAFTDGGFVVVPNEDEVRKYLVAPGNLVTFRIENKPIVIEKSMGRSQFASPTYKKYKLSEVNMDDNSPIDSPVTKEDSAIDYSANFDELKDTLNDVKSQMDSIKNMLRNFKPKFDNSKKDGDKS